MLRENKILTSLGLVACALGPESVFEISDALEVNTTLTSLDLSMNDFEDDQSASRVGKYSIGSGVYWFSESGDTGMWTPPTNGKDMWFTTRIPS